MDALVHPKKAGNRTGLNRAVVVRAAVTFSILAYLGLKIDWSELSKQLIQSDPILLLIAGLLCGSTVFLASVRWWLLLKVQKIYLPLKTVNALTFIGAMIDNWCMDLS